MKTFKGYLMSLNACKPAVEWAGDKPIEQVVAECHRGDWLLWLAKKCGVELQPLTLAKGHCANTVRHLMTDNRAVKAVDIAIAFGEGTATIRELHEAASATWASQVTAHGTSAHAAADAAAAAASPASYAAAASVYAACASRPSYTDASYADAVSANRKATADICRKYIGEFIIEKVNQDLNTKP